MTKKSGPALVLTILFLAALARAQYQARLEGQVLDAQGSPLEKVEVSIVSQRTSSIRFDLKTGKDGRFLQVGLMPGYYLVSFRKSGFAPNSTEVHVGVAGEMKVNVTLQAAGAEAQRTFSAADKLFLKGNELYAKQDFAAASEAYVQAIGVNPGNWGYHLNLGLAYKKMGRSEDALAQFMKAAELNPESYSAEKEAGEALAKAGWFPEARGFYEKAAELSPDDPDAHYNLGVCLVNIGEPEPALAQFEKASELRPDYADAYYQAATILIGQNRIPEAVAALELAPDSPQAGIARQLLQALKK